MSGRLLPIIIVGILFLPSILPIAAMGNGAIGVSVMTVSAGEINDLVKSPLTDGRSNLEKTQGGGS